MSNPGIVVRDLSNPTTTEDFVERFMTMSQQLEGWGCSENVKDSTRVLRRKMLAGNPGGEVGEYLDAEFANDPVEMADGLADTIVIATGTLLQYFGPVITREILAEVHRSNDDKINGKHGDIVWVDGVVGGKVGKPKGWKAPDISSILKKHNWQFIPSDQSFIPDVVIERDYSANPLINGEW